MHCPFLIKPGEEPPKGAQFAILCRFENSRWSQNYVAGIQKMVHRLTIFHRFECGENCIKVEENYK